jgi:GNAT superfamily N-acetyltransferase
MLLPPIEAAAAELFRPFAHITGLGNEQLAKTNSVADFALAQANGLLWIATDESDRAVGFLLLRRFDNVLHVHEFDIHPAHARKGVGRELLRQVIEWARAQHAPAVTLTTYREIPWNAPFYARMGFVELPASQWTPALKSIRDWERSNGWRMSARVAMRLNLLAG